MEIRKDVIMLDRYKGIKSENIYKLTWYMEHFDLDEVVLCPETAKESVIFTYLSMILRASGIKVKRCGSGNIQKFGISKKSRKSLFVASDFGLKAVAANGFNGMPIEDFCSIFKLEDERLVPKTMVYNTLENCYSSLLVIGDSSFAKEMKEYYRGNTCVPVRTMGSDAISFKDGKYLVSTDSAEDELVMVMDPIPQFPVIYDNSDVEANVFFVNNLFRGFFKPVETYKRDIDDILKTLIKRGVTVVTVCSANRLEFKDDKKLAATIESWDKLRHKDSEEFNRKRHEARGTTCLLPNQRSLTHSYAKGYSQMYGNGEYINFLNGFRVTTGNKVSASHDIYMFGACVVRDLGADDDHTLASMIKREIGDDYNVHNYGSEIHGTNLIMRTLDYKPGDVIIWWSLDSVNKIKNKIPGAVYCDLTEAYKKVPDLYKHIFDDINHYDMTVKKQVVKEIAGTVRRAIEQSETPVANDVISFCGAHKRIPGIELVTDSDLLAYIGNLEKEKRLGKNGAIVMNCNPFTKGHRYLIETAASKVDNLYVFVVEEDKSVFKFDDRLKMVELGTADIGNVIVKPSGKYILSAQTLPGYFTKAEFKDAYLNASDDLEFFMQIAKVLDISVRFVGEEPIDLVTRQYNDNMRRVLPKYGMEFVEIPRKTVDGSEDVVISASRVRKLIAEKDYEGIKAIVPTTTYEYLRDKLGMVI